MSLETGRRTFQSGSVRIETLLTTQSIERARDFVRRQTDPILQSIYVLDIETTATFGGTRLFRERPPAIPAYPLGIGFLKAARDEDVTRNRIGFGGSGTWIAHHRIDEERLLLEAVDGHWVAAQVSDLEGAAVELAEYTRQALAEVAPGLAADPFFGRWIQTGQFPWESGLGCRWEYSDDNLMVSVAISQGDRRRLRTEYERHSHNWPYWGLWGKAWISDDRNTIEVKVPLPVFASGVCGAYRRLRRGAEEVKLLSVAGEELTVVSRGEEVWLQWRGSEVRCSMDSLRRVAIGVLLDTYALVGRIVPEYDWSVLRDWSLDGLDVSCGE